MDDDSEYQIDILRIDSLIREKYKKTKNKSAALKRKLDTLKKIESSNKISFSTFTNKKIMDNIKDLEKEIEKMRCDNSLNFYIVETAEIIRDYQLFLKKPLKQNFMGKKIKNESPKKSLVSKYLNVASKHIDKFKIKQNIKAVDICIKCQNCSGTDFNISEDNIYLCKKCFTQKIVSNNTSSYSDISRINISAKYMYDRKVHFRDCINQYQGKQNCTISENIYRELEEQFQKHHLLVESPEKYTKFSNITKEHVSMFLRELDYSKHYENMHLIHYYFTGIKPDNIGHLEDKLLNDFDILTALYDKRFKHLARKNFINTQYVLFQLLRRHKHPCKKEDFSILKTVDRKSFHDDVCKTLFLELSWNHYSYY